MRVSRRDFVAGAAASLCIGCGSSDDDGDERAEDRRRPDTSQEPEPGTTDAAPSTSDPSSARTTGFGGTIDVGPVADVAAQVEAGSGFHYVPEGRLWITRYPAEALPDAEAAYGPLEDAGIAAGFVALYQKCPHLGCRVPECVSSQRFECPCHGSVFNQVGEYVAGPAPRGMDRFPISIVDGKVHIDTAVPLEGAPHGTLTVAPEPAGPACVEPVR